MPDDIHSPETTIYFAFGSNIWIDQMNRRCPENKFLGVGLLREWRWIIDHRSFGNIHPSPGDYVYGFVYELSAKDEKSLDGFENVPIYYEKEIHPIEFTASSSDGEPEKRTINAMIYIYGPATTGTPAAEYVHRLNMAIKDALQKGIPQSYIDKYLRPFVPPESE